MASDFVDPSTGDRSSSSPLFTWFVVIHGSTPVHGAAPPALPPGTLFRLRGGDTIGRNADNDIVLTDAAVSGRHAQIFVQDVPDKGGIVVRDVGSANGIIVNGVGGAEHGLSDGDHVVFGQTHLVFRQVRR